MQLGDLETHLEKLEDDINNKIPDPEFSGNGVLDFEEWFAISDMNFGSGTKGMYKTESRKLVEKEHTGLSAADIIKIADEEYDQAAR